jgi:hypothetical protein
MYWKQKHEPTCTYIFYPNTLTLSKKVIILVPLGKSIIIYYSLPVYVSIRWVIILGSSFQIKLQDCIMR